MPHRPGDEDLERELRAHLELEAEEQRDTGLSADAARLQARRSLGNQTLLQETLREVWGANTLGRLRQDVRHAVRMLRRNPGFAAAAIATLALGIGANTAMFAVAYAGLLRPLAFPEPHRLVAVLGEALRQQVALVTLRQGSQAADYAAYTANTEYNLTGQGEPERLAGSAVSANLFSVFAQPAFAGRTFAPAEDAPGRDRVILLSYGLWQRRFRGDPQVIGRTLAIDDTPRQIVGILPPAFRFPSPQTEFWIPLHLDPREDGAWFWLYNLNLVARLRPGFTRDQAEAELRAFVPRIRDSFPWKMWPDFGANARLAGFRESLTGDLRTRLLVLLSAVGLVLLIACVNVANLLLASGTSRQKEIAVRLALGATRTRVLRQLLTESLVLAAAGGAAGLLLALLLSGLFRHVAPNLPRVGPDNANLEILVFTTALSLAVGLGFGLIPAWRFSRRHPQTWLKSEERAGGSRVRRRLTSVLVAVEIALGVVVAIGAGLLARSFWELLRVHPGFRTQHTLSALVTPNPSLFRAPARGLNFYQELLDRLRALPGVEAAAAVSPLPLGGDVAPAAVELEGHPLLPGHAASSLLTTSVTPGYFAAVDIPLLAGRGFLPSDAAGAEEVAIVTAATAQRWWPGENPIGKHLKFTWLKTWKRIVGVVGDTRDTSLAGEPAWIHGHFYLPLAQNPAATRMTLVVRAAGEPLALERPLRQILSSIRADVPLTRVRTLDEVVSASLATPRSTMWLLFSFAALALLLSATGIYAVVAYTVAQRTREIGIRMALGARRRNIVAGILRHSAVVCAIGAAAGVAAAFAATRVLRAFLFQVTVTDTATFVCMPLLLLAVALLATCLPARRAARVDPAITLRCD